MEPLFEIEVVDSVLVLTHTQSRSQLIIERHSGRIRMQECRCLASPNSKKIYALMGLIQLNRVNYLSYVTEVEIVGNIDNKPIFKVEETEIVEICSTAPPKKYDGLNSSYYFSYLHDLTNSKQKSANTTTNLHEIANITFYCNLPFYQYFLCVGVDSKWFVPIIKGYICIKEFIQTGNHMTMGLISRLNKDIIEIEQLFMIKNHSFSYVQVCSTIPISYEENKGNLHLNHSFEKNSVELKSKITELSIGYEQLMLVGTFRLFNPIEGQLIAVLEEIIGTITEETPDLLQYRHFDNDEEEEQDSKLLKISDFASEIPNSFYYSNNGEPLSSQRMLIYTCASDRRKAAKMQMFLGWASLVSQMNQSGFVNFDLNLLQANSYPFGKIFRRLWSLSASNTIFAEPKKARTSAMDYLVTQRSIELRPKEQNMKLKVFTWNLGGHLPNKINMNDLTGENTEIIVFCFQEYVKLNPLNVLPCTKNKGTTQKLREKIDRALRDQYECIIRTNMVGLMMLVYIREDQLHGISRASEDQIKVAFKGQLGNKGAVTARFEIFDTSICICNCHLESGSSNTQKRVKQLNKIIKKAFQQSYDSGKNLYQVNNHDISIIAGDLNFRIDMDRNEVLDMIQLENIENLLEHDQLVNQIRERNLVGYEEPHITFAPTYKFDTGTDVYDTSKKQRVPAWCDRVLFRADSMINLRYYSNMSYRVSDHKPVVAEFLLKVYKSFDD